MPGWVAVMVTVPAPVMVTVDPVRVAGPETERATARLEVEVAVTTNGLAP